jgi:hypothetical protein
MGLLSTLEAKPLDRGEESRARAGAGVWWSEVIFSSSSMAIEIRRIHRLDLHRDRLVELLA